MPFLVHIIRDRSGKATDMIARTCTFPRLRWPSTKRHVMLNYTSCGWFRITYYITRQFLVSFLVHIIRDPSFQLFSWHIPTSAIFHPRLKQVATNFISTGSSRLFVRNRSWYHHEARERSEPFFLWFSKEKKDLFITGRTSIGCQKLKTKHSSVQCLYVCVIEHPLPSTALNAHGTNCSADGFNARTHVNEPYLCYCVVCRSKLAEADAETCVSQGMWLRLGHGFAIFGNSRNWSTVFCFFTRYKYQ